MVQLTFADAVRHGLAEEMRLDPTVWALGEDLSTAHGSTSAGQYIGLAEEFGPKRIVDTPISESTIMGAAVGAALAGTRPVAELRMADFGLCAMDELVNQAAKIRYMSGGQARVSLVVRQATGSRPGSAAQHSQSTEGWFAGVAGLVVVTPATPADGRGLLKSAIRCDDPVVFMEHKALWLSEGEVDLEDEGLVPIGEAKVTRSGVDITIVAWSRMALIALEAAGSLAEQGVDAEVIDLRSLWPWDEKRVLESVRKTRRLLVAQESGLVGGFANEVALVVTEKLHGRLLCPVGRLGAPRIPAPFAESLEQEFRVDAWRVVEAANRLVDVRKELRP